jgi:Cof subfamily protein (haloacid dehalogenase superfamily)
MELIVFDLDGTLLNADSEISLYTQETLRLLAEKQIAYTVATGRTLHSAKRLLEGNNFNLPHIYNNGVLIWDPQEKYMALDNVLTYSESEHIFRAAKKHNVAPFVSTIGKNHEHAIYHPPVQHKIEEYLIQMIKQRQKVALLPFDDLNHEVTITNVSVIGKGQTIDAIRVDIENEEHLVAYSGPAIEGQGNKWMDIHHSQASKGSAAALLKEQLGVKKLICFGDNDNDLSLFALADESYAPENARDEVKAAATAVIGHHDQDGIARYLRERFQL